MVFPSRQPALLQLSNAGSYAEVLSRSAEVLEQRPLDAEALLFRGVAHFYLALAEEDRSDPAPRLDQAIISLRRARLDGELRFRGEAAYVLGKAYYHKGPYFYDLAIRFLTESLEQGYDRADTHEYLGMALVRSGAPESGIEHFRTALQLRPSGLMYLSVGQLLERLGEHQGGGTALSGGGQRRRRGAGNPCAIHAGSVTIAGRPLCGRGRAVPADTGRRSGLGGRTPVSG